MKISLPLVLASLAACDVIPPAPESRLLVPARAASDPADWVLLEEPGRDPEGARYREGARVLVHRRVYGRRLNVPVAIEISRAAANVGEEIRAVAYVPGAAPDDVFELHLQATLNSVVIRPASSFVLVGPGRASFSFTSTRAGDAGVRACAVVTAFRPDEKDSFSDGAPFEPR